MSKGENTHRIYDKKLKTWFEVPADYYKEYDRERTAYRKRMQNHGRCCCSRNKFWLCDTMCEDCEFRRAGDLLSLDATGGDGSVTLLDQREAEGPRMEDVIEERDLLEHLFKHLQKFDSDADTIIALWKEDYTMSDRAVAKAIGCPQRTFADRMKRYRMELRKVRGY